MKMAYYFSLRVDIQKHISKVIDSKEMSENENYSKYYELKRSGNSMF